MKREKELVTNSIIIAIGNLSIKLVSFFLLPLYTSILSTTDYGLFDLLITISTFLLPFITLLMEESMFRFLIDCKTEDDKKEIISITVSFALKSSLIFMLLFFLVGFIIEIPYKVLFLMYILSQIFTSLKNAVVRGMGKIKIYSISNFASSALVIILNIFFIAYLNFGITGMLLANIIASFSVSICIFLIVNMWKYISFKKLNKIKRKEMIKYSIPLVPNSLSWAIINLSDRIVVSSFLGVESNGIYSVSYKFPNIMNTFYGFFYTSWKENAAKTIGDKDVNDYYNNIYKAIKRFMWTIVVGMISILPLVYGVLIKKDFIQSYDYVPILLISIYFSNISGFYGGIFSAYKNTKIMGTTTILGALINIIVDILLIKYVGIWAAAISTLVSCIIVYLYRWFKLKKYIKLKEEIRVYLFSIISLVISLISFYLKNNIINIIVLIFIAVFGVYINYDVIKVITKKIKNKRNKKN